jgi:hypothetical protein
MSEIILSRKVDEFVPKTRWIVSLSNGETIFEDHRVDQEATWIRLAKYVEECDISITSMRVQFESGLEIKLPPGQEGYIQKKKAWCTGQAGGLLMCVGYVQGNISQIHEASSSGDSVSKIVEDPGSPWTIYRKDIRESKHAIVT